MNRPQRLSLVVALLASGFGVYLPHAARAAADPPADGPSAAASKVEPEFVGRWKLAQPSLEIYWQVRADGSYRYFGVNARPLEHWGTMEAAGGRWSSRWSGGADGGSYTVSGNSWQVSGNAGTGTWQRVWKPGDGGSQGQCPLIDIAEVDALVGNATTASATATGCRIGASGIGYSDGVQISIIENAVERFANVRKQTNAMRPVIDLPGIGTAAFIDGDSVHLLKGSRYAVITAQLYPDVPEAVPDAALVRLARSVAARL